MKLHTGLFLSDYCRPTEPRWSIGPLDRSDLLIRFRLVVRRRDGYFKYESCCRCFCGSPVTFLVLASVRSVALSIRGAAPAAEVCPSELGGLGELGELCNVVRCCTRLCKPG